MNYRDLLIRTSPGYVSKRKHKPAPPITPPAFPFDKMKCGDYIQIPLKNYLDQAEINSIRSHAHSCARLCNIWIKTHLQQVFKHYKPHEKPEFVFQIMHDGERN